MAAKRRRSKKKPSTCKFGRVKSGPRKGKCRLKRKPRRKK